MSAFVSLWCLLAALLVAQFAPQQLRDALAPLAVEADDGVDRHLGPAPQTLGLAEEVRPRNIAVNSLWPVTVIESQASINWGLGTPEQWRKPDILVDCVLRLVQKEPGKVTGQALLDEDFLRSEGVVDFSGYACVPSTNPPRLAWPAASSAGS